MGLITSTRRCDFSSTAECRRLIPETQMEDCALAAIVELRSQFEMEERGGELDWV